VLLPETLAASNAAKRGRIQISVNLALGSAMASIGLTIPVIGLATIGVAGQLVLGLGSTQTIPDHHRMRGDRSGGRVRSERCRLPPSS